MHVNLNILGSPISLIHTAVIRPWRIFDLEANRDNLADIQVTHRHVVPDGVNVAALVVHLILLNLSEGKGCSLFDRVPGIAGILEVTLGTFLDFTTFFEFAW
jgi:hypothetical protein